MSTPFYLGDVDIPGVDPGDPIPNPTQPGKFFLGDPALGMIELPSPRVGYTANGSQGEVLHGLFGGGAAVTRWPSMMRAYSLPYERLAGRDRQIINAFYKRQMVGDGPWVFVVPEDINRLTLAQSMCGALNGVVEGWLVNVGTLAYEPATAPAIIPCGVMRWTPVVGGNALISGATGGTFGVPDLDHAAPYLPAMPHTVTWWALASATGLTLTAHLVGVLADGTVIDDQAGATVSLSATVPTPITITIDPMDLAGAQYPLPKLVVGGAVSGHSIALSNPLLSYTDQVEEWEMGCGVPRVLWAAGRDQAVNPTLTSDITMQLVESIDGAA